MTKPVDQCQYVSRGISTKDEVRELLREIDRIKPNSDAEEKKLWISTNSGIYHGNQISICLSFSVVCDQTL